MTSQTFRIPEMVLGALWSSIPWAIILGWLTAYAPSELEKQHCYEALQRIGQRTEECKTFWERATSDPVALFTLVLALSTVVLAVSTILLWNTTSHQLRIARRDFIATHRPRVIVRFIQGLYYTDGGQQAINVTLVNIGVGRAVITALGSDLARRGEDGNWSPPGVSATAKPYPPITLGSGERHSFEVAVPYTDLHIAADALDIYEWCAVGEIKYKDDNGIIRETGFFRVYDKKTNRFIPSPNADEEYQD